MKNEIVIGNYRIELFRKQDNSWNWCVYSIWEPRYCYVVANACYPTRKDALESAKDYISRQ
jgi:hypothetical protein